MIEPSALREGQIAIATAKDECPYLTAEGIEAVPSGTKFEQARNDFSPEGAATAVFFLRRCRPTKRTRLSSYSLKHDAERWGKASAWHPT
jgi:hypothetical protein